jgi:hypothetical protein
MRQIEQHATQRWSCLQNGREQRPVTPANINDTLRTCEVVGGHHSDDLPSRT